MNRLGRFRYSGSAQTISRSDTLVYNDWRNHLPRVGLNLQILLLSTHTCRIEQSTPGDEVLVQCGYALPLRGVR